MENVPTPSITKEDVLALATAVVTSLVVLFKLDLTDAQQAAAVTLLCAAYAIFQLAAGAWRRGKRAQAHALIVSAQAAQVAGILEAPTATTGGMAQIDAPVGPDQAS